MMQSYKHFSALPDPSFVSRVATSAQIHQYKKIVGQDSKYTNLDAYDYKLFFSIAVYHLMKANYILEGAFELPSIEEYLRWDFTRIFDYQLNLFQKEGKVSVLNTCIFQLCDFAPSKFFQFIQHHRDELQLP